MITALYKLERKYSRYYRLWRSFCWWISKGRSTSLRYYPDIIRPPPQTISDIMQPLKTKTCWFLSRLSFSFSFSSSDADKRNLKQPFEASSPNVLPVVLFVVVHSSTNFNSVRKATNTALNFVRSFPHSSRHLLGKPRHRTGEVFRRVEAEEATPRWFTSGKSEWSAAGSRH